ncbi:hypothetical protein AVEN_24362-1 [Araneus ventricosus]|uniref:Uncharacterized protein n=1 Tax=Araneus ventricosus TaxID=182803 RepID=A0A4Y2HUL0_ARAVE|nr:hypothetical protein AVEN_24362-1 [Araneus ventricosus]
MDLQTISSQMKVVIQKHQIVVTEMRNDPQNPVLQKRLNDLKLEIQSLNERQLLSYALVHIQWRIQEGYGAASPPKQDQNS